MLYNSMPAATQKKFQVSLQEMARKVPGEDGHEGAALRARYAKLDLLSAAANREATREVARLMGRKAD